MEEAIAAVKAHGLLARGELKKFAEKFGVNQSTLGRRVKGRTGSRTQGYQRQQKLPPPEELEVLRHIDELTVKGVPPTIPLVSNLATEVAHEPVGLNWAYRFIHHHQHHLISKQTTGMNRTRHLADSGVKYKEFFDEIHRVIDEYNIKTENQYNMDEKGFLFGIIGKTKRVFSRSEWERGAIREALQDGSRTFLTTIACICANGESLPASLIYETTSGDIQANWVQDFEPGKHNFFITTSPSGWSNDEIGLSWIEQVFERFTKPKVVNRKDWRLLILDGHSSHVNMAIISYTMRHGIVLCVLPSHSTHTLQPLDVVVFSPLSRAYTNALVDYLHRNQGMIPLTKADFIPLFWQAWSTTFTPELIKKAFLATGISPLDPDRILKKFTRRGNGEGDDPYQIPQRPERPFVTAKRLLRVLVKDLGSPEARELLELIQRLVADREITAYLMADLEASIHHRRRREQTRKVLDLEPDQDLESSVMLYSPSKVKAAKEKLVAKEEKKRLHRLRKIEKKVAQASNKRYKQQQKEARREARANDKVRREKERAEKAREQALKKEARDAQKALKLSQKSKRKASQAAPSPAPSKKRYKQSGVDSGAGRAPERAPSPPAKITSRGRSVHLPDKYK
jgi:hypothetical protein